MLQKNFHHLYADIAWYGVLAGSTLAFLSVYLARLGADSFKIGLVTAGPALVNLLISLPIGSILPGRSLIRVPFWSALLQRSGYLLLLFFPFYYGDQLQITSTILLIIMIAFPGTLLAISINAALAEIVPVQYRAEVVGKRNAFLAITTTFSALVSGVLLDRISFPLNYQIVFGLGWAGSLVSTYHLSQLRPTDPQLEEAAGSFGWKNLINLDQIKTAFQTVKKHLRSLQWGFSNLIKTDLLHDPIGRFMAAYLVFYTFQYLGPPIFPLVYVESLHLTDGMISLGSALFYIAMFLSSLKLKPLAARFGHRKLLIFSALMFGVYPLLVGLARGPFLFWMGSLLGGLDFGVVTASLLNRLMEVVPESKRASGMSLHNLALNLGILLGSLSGPVLVYIFHLRGAMMWVAFLRSLSGLILLFWA